MPDKWEFPWFASWDLGFHCITLAHVDPQLAKEQILLMLREWYMHPNGQIPAYEWDFNDVNPPVLSLAARAVFDSERQRTGVADYAFMERVFQKMLLNFTWWGNNSELGVLGVLARVNPRFQVCCLSEKFAQAAKTFEYCSTKITNKLS
jgi:hypothetical protein